MGMISGMWYPQILGDNDEPQCTFTRQFGGYRKMGQLVYFNVDLIVNTVNAGAGGGMHVQIPPFLPVQLNFTFEVSLEGVAAPANTVKVGAWIEGSEGLYMFFPCMLHNGSTDGLDCDALTDGCHIIISGGYIAEE